MKRTGCSGKTTAGEVGSGWGVGKGKRAKLMSANSKVYCRGWEGSSRQAVDAFTTFRNVNGIVLRL